MIPDYIKWLADLIYPGWADLEEEDIHEIIGAAYRIHSAGYRKPVLREDAMTLSNGDR